MNRIFSIISLFFIPYFAFAKGINFSLDGVTIPKSVNFIYGQVFKKPFMISPEVITDTRLVSFHITPDLDEKAFFVRYLNNMGIGVTNKSGVDYIYKLKIVEPVIPQHTFVYKPKYRSVGYLTSVLSSVVQGRFGHGGSMSAYVGGSKASNNSSGANSFASSGDMLVFYGTKADISRIEQVLPSVDTISDEVYVGGYVYQVQTTERNGSGLALAAKLLSQHFSIQMGGATGGSMDNFIKFSSGNLSALVELFNTDSRFTVVSSPSLRARSGTSASFSVGEDVPVLGNVSYSGDKSVQSVEYRSSGVIFNVMPEVRQDVIDLSISQELSNFAKTHTGVNNSPTLIKRNIQTSVSVNDGDIILIGGLADNKDTGANTGLSFMPSWFSTSSKEKTKTDIVIILQAKKVKR
ncbi:type II secretion system protein GspD [Xenorhabdus bovienii]|uniref:Type II secretion system protein GspD n=1 Tax=Xenorhabdus bovienii TaxID=40576 RepID=A0AAJ1J7G9_XENBV|nr:type II secretion system protein GspD [Xenorhabdus bovienii]MDE1477667.1 type II secretion system protein GspD [Xenorhabdus bovienii]MDE1493937.1 type II secretion system protein GspD [Xenorhabdus bovienii]MDE9471950.1 type II secretion system protein GspD [Xenorhabdus bovienii]MDE9509408.1 type II secretion system protein GspD [Xenorhabdus bovienii]MDE9521053.1 type II secretion system protein GspD [Xenorhabdus bovienii]